MGKKSALPTGGKFHIGFTRSFELFPTLPHKFGSCDIDIILMSSVYDKSDFFHISYFVIKCTTLYILT